MQYPMSEEDARDQIADGRLVQGLLNNQGYQKLFKPFLLKILEEADIKCHDIKLREDRGKYAIAEYNVIKNIMNFCDEYIENMKLSMEYCKDNNIVSY